MAKDIIARNYYSVTFDGIERQWRLMAKPRKEKRDAPVRGECDKAPYYHTDDTAVEKQTVTISPMAGCKNLTVNCKKNGITLEKQR